MTTEERVDVICVFLQENVAPHLTLKKPDDDDAKHVLWVQPDVYAVYLPVSDPGKDDRSCTPCFVVMPIKDTRNRDDGVLNVRVGVMTWSPGTRKHDGLTLDMDREGWRQLQMVLDKVGAAFAEGLAIGDMEVMFPIVQSPYQDGESVPDLRPYYLGQVDVPMRYILPRRLSPAISKLLE